MATAMLTMTREVKDALRDRAEREGSSVNNVAVRILAAAYGVEASSTGRSSVSGDALSVTLRMPDALKRRIDVAAARRGRSMRAEILSALEVGLDLSVAA